jgi:hypothetical protein
MERWSRYYDTTGRTAQYEISPMAITLSGDTAVVNYGAVTMRERLTSKGAASDDKPERDMVGITETLVRQGNGWKFLSSASFPIGK